MFQPKKPVKVIFSDEESPEARQVWQTIVGGTQMRTVFKSLVFPMFATFLAWLLLDRYSSSIGCQFRDDPRLLMLWPPNLIYSEQLSRSSFSDADICWMFAVTSTSSAIWLAWLAWRFGYEAFRSDVVFVPGSAKIFLVRLAAFQLVLVLVAALGWSTVHDGFYPTPQVLNLTIKAPMAVNAFKVVFVLGPLSFFVFGTPVETTLLFVRCSFPVCLNVFKSNVARR